MRSTTLLSKRTIAGLAAGTGLGLLLAGAVVGGWWLLDARHQPVRLAKQAQAQAALNGAATVVVHTGQRPVYVVGPRSNPDWELWLRGEGPRLARMGRQVSTIIVPSNHGGMADEATVAQMWLTPDRNLLDQWLQAGTELWSAAGLPAVRSDPQRQEALARSRSFATQIGELAGATGRWPLVFWNDPTGALVVCVCDTEKSQAKARAMLGLTGQGTIPDVAQGQNPEASEQAVEEHLSAMPYPQLFSPPEEQSFDGLNEPVSEVPLTSERAYQPERLPGDPSEQAVRAAPTTTANPAPSKAATARAARPGRAVNTAPPAATKEAEALFY